MNEFQKIAKKIQNTTASAEPCEWCGRTDCVDISCQNSLAKVPKTSERLKDALKLIGVPKIYLDTKQSHWSDKKPIYDLFRFEPTSYYLYGLPGRGKTYLAASLVKCWFMSNPKLMISGGKYNAIWSSYCDILGEIKDCYVDNAKESGIIKKFSNVGVLVVDDFMAGNKTDWSVGKFYSIFDKRISSGKITIVTSNSSIGDIEQVEPRIASRLSGFEVLEITNSVDRRIKGKI